MADPRRTDQPPARPPQHYYPPPHQGGGVPPRGMPYTGAPPPQPARGGSPYAHAPYPMGTHASMPTMNYGAYGQPAAPAQQYLYAGGGGAPPVGAPPGSVVSPRSTRQTFAMHVQSLPPDDQRAAWQLLRAMEEKRDRLRRARGDPSSSMEGERISSPPPEQGAPSPRGSQSDLAQQAADRLRAQSAPSRPPPPSDGSSKRKVGTLKGLNKIAGSSMSSFTGDVGNIMSSVSSAGAALRGLKAPARPPPKVGEQIQMHSSPALSSADPHVATAAPGEGGRKRRPSLLRAVRAGLDDEDAAESIETGAPAADAERPNSPTSALGLSDQRYVMLTRVMLLGPRGCGKNSLLHTWVAASQVAEDAEPSDPPPEALPLDLLYPMQVMQLPVVSKGSEVSDNVVMAICTNDTRTRIAEYGRRFVDAVVLVFSLMSRASLTELEEVFCLEVKKYCSNAKVVIVGTHKDKRAGMTAEEVKASGAVEDDAGKKVADEMCAEYVEVNALIGDISTLSATSGQSGSVRMGLKKDALSGVESCVDILAQVRDTGTVLSPFQTAHWPLVHHLLCAACSSTYTGRAMDVIRLLLGSSYSITLEDVDAIKLTPLHHATRLDNAEALSLLLDCTDIMRFRRRGQAAESLLNLATRLNHKESCFTLLAAGAFPDEADPPTEAPIVVAARSGYLEILDAMAQKCASATKLGPALNAACAAGETAAINVLLNHGAKMKWSDSLGKTGLHYACMAGQKEVVELYTNLEPGSLNARDDEKNTGLHYAAAKGWLDVVNLLLKSGAQIDRKDRHPTPLHLACRYGEYDVVRALVEGGADKEAKCTFKDKRANQIMKDMTPLAVWAVSSEKARVDNSDLLIGRYLVHEQKVSAKRVARLDLSDHHLEHIEFEKDLLPFIVPLKYLDLRNNKLQSVPQQLTKFRELKSVKLTGNPLATIPQKFREWPRLKEYLVSLEQKATKWTERKVLFVGRPGVGKSTLLKCFKDKKHRVSCTENMSTDGISIERDLSLSKDSNMLFHAWDLGGQEVFYPTHQFFLTSNCYYILVFDLADPHMHRIDYWMLLLRSLGKPGEAPPAVILVGTHLDKVRASEAEATLNKVGAKYPAYRFPGLKEITAVSCATGAGVPELMSTLCQLASKDSFNADISVDWVKLHQVIRSQSVDHTDWSTYCRWADQCGVPIQQLPMATEFFKDMGSLIHFNDDSLKELVILNPQWLSDAMSTLITIRHSWAKGGRLHARDLHHVFMKHSAELQQQLLALLEQFSIIFPMKEDPSRKRGATLRRMKSAITGEAVSDVVYIVPSLLPKTPVEPVEAVWPSLLPNGFLEQGRVYEFPFLPIGFFSRLIVYAMHIPNVEGVLFWSSGIILKLEDQMAYVSYDQVTFKLSINSRFPELLRKKAKSGVSLLTKLVEMVGTIVECFYPRLQEGLCVLVPCTHCYLSRDLSIVPFLFTLQECVEAAHSQSPFLYCQRIETQDRCVQLKALAADVAMSDIESIDPADLIIERKLGQGGFGMVYKGKWNGLDVAVKQLKLDSMGDDEETVSKFQEFQQEVWVMSKLDHPCLTKLYGITVSPLQMVMEFASKGDLNDLLRPKVNGERGRLPEDALPMEFRLALIIDIARAMRYLHGIHPPVVHRDLRSPNVFMVSLDLAAPVRAQVADFGLSRGVAGQIAGMLKTWQWLAPEVIDPESSSYDERADTFSFGIVAYEILSCGEMPYEEYIDDARFALSTIDSTGRPTQVFQEATIKNAIVHNQLRPTFPASTNPKLLKILHRCLAHNPNERPPFPEILKVLSSVSGRTVPSVRKDVRDLGQSLRMSRPGMDSTLTGSRLRCSTVSGSSVDTDDLEVDVDRSSIKVVTALPAKQARVAKHRVKTRAPCERVFSLLHVDDTVWAGGSDGYIMVYDAKTGKEKQHWMASTQRIYSLVRVGTKHVWCGAEDGRMSVWNISDRVCVREWAAHSDPKAFLKCLVVVHAQEHDEVWAGLPLQNEIRIFHAESMELLRTVNLTASGVSGGLVCMSQRENEVWVGTRGNIVMYTTNSAVCVATFPLYEVHERMRDVHVILSVGQERIWTALDTDIRVWEIRDEQLIQIATLRVHSGKVYCLCQWGNYVCSGSFDKKIILWDLQTLEAVQVLEGYHDDSVRAMMVVDEVMWSAGLGGNVCLWR